MTGPYAFTYTNLLQGNLEDRMDTLSQSELDLLENIYSLKSRAVAMTRVRAAGVSFVQQLNTIDQNLGEALSSALVANPKVMDGEDVMYSINGVDVKCKLDTGAKGVVVDARNIVWDKADDEELSAAHLAYAEAHPNSGNLTKEKLAAFDPKYADLDYGTVTEYEAPFHEGKDGDGKDYKSVVVKGPFKVVTIGRPKNSSGKRAPDLRAGIEVPMQREGFDEVSTQVINLVARDELTRRVLLGKDFLEDKIIMYGKHDTRILDEKKLDVTAVRDALNFNL